MPSRALLAVALLVTLLAGSRDAAGQTPTSERPATPAAPAGAAAAVGSICVLRHLLPDQMPYRGAGELPPTKTYAISLDGGPFVPLSTKTSVLLADIPRAGRHKVVIRGAGRPYATFFFRYEPGDPDAHCLYQNDMYQSWQLMWTKESFKECRCQGIGPSAWQAARP
jgi:hypothetical protein